MSRAPLLHTAAPTCLLEVPGDSRTTLFSHVTCPACREDGLRKGRDALAPRTRLAAFKPRKKGR